MTPTTAVPVSTAIPVAALQVPSARLVARNDDDTPVRVLRSIASIGTGTGPSITQMDDWLTARRAAHQFSVARIPLAELDGWSTDQETGSLGHRSGRFFTVHGLDVTVEDVDGGTAHWQQPIIDQPEVGILGILAKEIDGVLHVLMQAKMEPGNPNLVQLSPTVQATRSNYTAVHLGSRVRFLEYFTEAARHRVLVDVLQSEHGSWFLGKYNRNMIVETDDHVPVDEDFCWLPLGHVGQLLRTDLAVNMDARTVLSCLPLPGGEPQALFGDTELASWLTNERSVRRVRQRLVPLRSVAEWRQCAHVVERSDGRFFSVIGVRVDAPNREVRSWTQPLIEPSGPGVVAFVTRTFDGVAHLLVSARAEAGFTDSIQVGPTVQCIPDNHRVPPPFLEFVLSQETAPQIRYDVLHSEEGGRFRNAVSRYLIVSADATPDAAPAQLPRGFRWVTPGQLDQLVQAGRNITVQARSLLAALKTGAAVL
jgi:oxidase EvaA